MGNSKEVYRDFVEEFLNGGELLVKNLHSPAHFNVRFLIVNRRTYDD